MIARFTRDQLRSRRVREVRARTEDTSRLPKRELQIGTILYPEDTESDRPRTRGECAGGFRPCPFAACRYHLYLDVDRRNGSIKLNFPDLEVDQLSETCALDVADRGGARLEDVGATLNVTRERIRQLEVQALAKMARAGAELREHTEQGPVGRRHLPVLGGPT